MLETLEIFASIVCDAMPLMLANTASELA